MAKNIAEEFTDTINSNIFFEEFTFSENELQVNNKQQIELADNIVWIDDILLLYQIKWRELANVDEQNSDEKWFQNKVIKKAKNQIKNTLKYFETYSTLNLTNKKGFTVNLSLAPANTAKKIILYQPENNFSQEQRFIKFYHSSEVGLIHLFHLEDYRAICQYLYTPAEINDYLRFREDLYNRFTTHINTIPEQLVMGYYISGEEIKELSFQHIEYLKKFKKDRDDFDLSRFIHNFLSKTIKQENTTDYFHIIRQLAKLNRFELKEFKDRLLLSLEKINEQDYTLPYRVTFPRTGCGFVFIPMPKGQYDKWKNALYNFTFAHKYDQKIEKCIGVILFKNVDYKDLIDIYWLYSSTQWEYDEEMEKLLKNDFPFRTVTPRLTKGYDFIS